MEGKCSDGKMLLAGLCKSLRYLYAKAFSLKNMISKNLEKALSTRVLNGLQVISTSFYCVKLVV